ncbi:hypothetical protein VFPPC_10083 [Pochonia chlamydosporia 170]|uniref:Uncharacterized protein n=1 Tax=Pochonia chlamydosporia 170 TaxID=1380566 RepID=A0A179F3P7_METCM|nr:hypothetical protein VFPPC_10083 [Pochonia chlamydosporia 170]OAQ59991.1 hypothetical protein VFPPC_10083 [Pochonia chlamydosporia 170]
MKFISIVALLAPTALAAKQAPGDAWITLLKQQCPDMPERCIDIAKKVHQPRFDMVSVTAAIPACIPAFGECIKNLSGGSDAISAGPWPGAAQGKLVTCLLQIAPDHLKYFLDNDSAGTPIPPAQNCALRELHRVAHVELGPLA